MFFIPFCRGMTKAYAIEVTTAVNRKYRPPCFALSWTWDGPGTWNKVRVRLFDVLDSKTDWVPVKHLVKGATTTVVVKDLLKELSHIQISYQRPDSKLRFISKCDYWKLNRIIVRDLIDHKSYVTKCNCWFDRQHHVVDRKLHEFTPKVDSVDNTYEGEDESGLSSILSWAGK
ncbi:hypothetical protein SNEBB_006526 [Seison nebaliae]|nr:hypothetical protein SNEBB_006526 [Seison nebaliae]